jgi:hypothetical protein
MQIIIFAIFSIEFSRPNVQKFGRTKAVFEKMRAVKGGFPGFLGS